MMAQAFGTSAVRDSHSACGSPPGAHHPAARLPAVPLSPTEEVACAA
ncbi:hypothetical protein [Lentzea sp. HUAS12]|nr:hypothetical protein [Lentzea sp. HUAS12]USX55141.1 hypothetical protein ND450_13885 [Lentzea sp. HUAS12]